MKKSFRLVENHEITKSAAANSRPLDWNKCIFCQEDSAENVRCPADSVDKLNDSGYTSIVASLTAFCDLGCLPPNIDMTEMDDGDGLEKTFTQRKAKFHKTCRLKFNQPELKRAAKRKMCVKDEVTDIGAQETFTWQKASRASNPVNKCFFCEQPASDALLLHKVSTFGLDSRVRQFAINLQDQHLLAKLSEGDLIATEAEYHVQCVVYLYNRDRDRSIQSDAEYGANVAHSTAFAELISYMQTVLEDDNIAPSLHWKNLTLTELISWVKAHL